MFDWKSFLRGFALGARLSPEEAPGERVAYAHGLQGRACETSTRRELGAWFQGMGDHAGQ